MNFLWAVLLCLLVSNVALADDKPIAVDQLPAAAKTFTQKHFKGMKILYAEKDRNSYECGLDNGTEIEFDKKGNWKKVECKGNTAIPAAIVPKVIQNYVKSKYPKLVINKIEKERYGYDVELSNNAELKFNKSGKFLGIDR